MSLKAALTSGKFVVTAEVGPAKGIDVSEVNELGGLLAGRVDAVNATDQQSAVMKLGSMVTCYVLQNKGLDTVLQLTCRDRNRLALQSDLLSAWVLGIQNVLALTGDLPQLGDHPQAKPVYDIDSVQLLSAIGRLNDGYDMGGHELKGRPNFFAGAVVNPGADTEASLELQIAKMEKKVKAGAKFFQTQAVYEPEKFANFMKRVGGLGVPVLAGIIPLKSVSMARFMNKNIAGISVPEELIKKMADAKDKTQAGIDIAAGLIRDLRSVCQGVHIMAIGWEKKIPKILEDAGI